MAPRTCQICLDKRVRRMVSGVPVAWRLKPRLGVPSPPARAGEAAQAGFARPPSRALQRHGIRRPETIRRTQDKLRGHVTVWPAQRVRLRAICNL